jgi:hypothetical protein
MAGYQLLNSDYNYLIPGLADGNSDIDNPAIAAVPVKDTDSLTKLSQLFPAAGRRSTTGAISLQGTEGTYWSDIPLSSSSGSRLYFSRTQLSPTGTTSGYPWGMSIRCVRI